jgi:peroxiredoxin
MTPYPAGTLATDFTLRDLDGTQVTLSTLLATRPVLMVHGSFT